MGFSVGSVPGQPVASFIVPQSWRRGAHPTVGPRYLGPIGAPASAQPSVGSAPDVPRWTARQMVLPASGAATPEAPSRPQPLYSGGEFPAYSGRALDGVDQQIAAAHAQRLPWLWRSGLTGTAGFGHGGGGTATMQHADGYGMLLGYGPLLQPAIIPKLVYIGGFNAGSQFRPRGYGPVGLGVPGIFVPPPQMGSR